MKIDYRWFYTQFSQESFCTSKQSVAFSKNVVLWQLGKTVQKVFGNYNSHLQCGSYSRNNGHLEMSFSTVRYINLNFLHFRSDFFYGMYCRTEKLFSHVFIELIFKCISLIFWIIVLVLVFLFQLFLSFLHLYLWVL